MFTLEKSQICDSDICYSIIVEGRKFQQRQGFVQWTDEYPNRETIRDDAEKGKGYVLKSDGKIAGYMCIDFDGEPAYNEIRGQWRLNEKYAVVHRMAFAEKYRGMGLTGKAFELIEKLCLENGIRYIRIDTDFPNKRMQHILTKSGFVNCGIIIFRGSDKLAYDKIL